MSLGGFLGMDDSMHAPFTVAPNLETPDPPELPPFDSLCTEVHPSPWLRGCYEAARVGFDDHPSVYIMLRVVALGRLARLSLPQGPVELKRAMEGLKTGAPSTTTNVRDLARSLPASFWEAVQDYADAWVGDLWDRADAGLPAGERGGSWTIATLRDDLESIASLVYMGTGSRGHLGDALISFDKRDWPRATVGRLEPEHARLVRDADPLPESWWAYD